MWKKIAKFIVFADTENAILQQKLQASEICYQSIPVGWLETFCKTKASIQKNTQKTFVH